MCPKHPKYKAKLRPRVPCDDCWYKYLNKHYIMSMVYGLIKRPNLGV